MHIANYGYFNISGSIKKVKKAYIQVNSPLLTKTLKKAKNKPVPLNQIPTQIGEIILQALNYHFSEKKNLWIGGQYILHYGNVYELLKYGIMLGIERLVKQSTSVLLHLAERKGVDGAVMGIIKSGLTKLSNKITDPELLPIINKAVDNESKMYI